MGGVLEGFLTIGAVIGEDGEIAGYTLFNDWSARDLQGREMSVGLGPAKGKDFATSIGPWLVTPDELPIEDGRLQIEATVEVNGEVVTTSDAAAMHWSWPQLVAQAARETRLVPGDVLGSGTLNRGCLLELNTEDGAEPAWLQPGDLVFFYSDLHHVGIYIGGGKVVHAPTTGDVVKVANMSVMPYAGAGRP